MKRLFVPLNSAPWHWFRDGEKSWELRRAKGQFALDRVTRGRDVELRRGYSTPDRLFGTVMEAFVAINQARVKLNALQLHRASVRAGDPHAVELSKISKECGVQRHNRRSSRSNIHRHGHRGFYQSKSNGTDCKKTFRSGCRDLARTRSFAWKDRQDSDTGCTRHVAYI